MTVEFYWSGAPEGERWVTSSEHEVRWVITEGGQVYGWLPLTDEWKLFSNRPDRIRANGTRVESARPVPRVGDRVRLSVEGVVTAVFDEGITLRTDDGDEDTYFRPSWPGTEVLQRADPPLQPGDLVRDGIGAIWQLQNKKEGCAGDRFAKVTYSDGSPAACGGLDYPRSVLGNGPLVKVQLTEVQP